MGPFDSGGSCSSSSSSGPEKSSTTTTTAAASEMDGHLAGAGYKVRLSDLRQVAQRLEHLENVMISAPDEVSQLASDAVHYNPSNIASWVDSMLSELTHPFTPLPSDLSPFPETPDFSSDPFASPAAPWPPTHQQQLGPYTVVVDEEEDSGIRLVHLLMTCAESVQIGDTSLAGSLIEDMQVLLKRVNTSCGIGKVAGYFVDALTRRLLFSPQTTVSPSSATAESEILYHHFYEACPYLKFAHFTANQAILEAFTGHDSVHVIDFNLMHGLQWPALIQALALRPGGPPLLRLTGIGPPSPDGRDTLREIGLRLAELAWSVNVRFAFRGVAAARLDDVKPWMLQVNPGEAVAVNSIMQLHKLLGSGSDSGQSALDTVLGWIRGLNPKIMTVVEQEANHNQATFLERFTEALYYYSTMFDSLDGCAAAETVREVAEMYVQREIWNVVGCEGAGRVERHEPLSKWRERLGGAGFKGVHLGSNAFKQASMLLTLFSAEGYCVEETEGCLTLGWHSRPLIAASAWRVAEDTGSPATAAAVTETISELVNESTL